jgi:hypothetical protein
MNDASMPQLLARALASEKSTTQAYFALNHIIAIGWILRLNVLKSSALTSFDALQNFYRGGDSSSRQVLLFLRSFFRIDMGTLLSDLLMYE